MDQTGYGEVEVVTPRIILDTALRTENRTLNITKVERPYLRPNFENTLA